MQHFFFELGIDYDELSGDNKIDKVRELVLFAERYGRLAELLSVGKKIRGDVLWPEMPEKKIEPFEPPKPAPSLAKPVETRVGDIKLSLINTDLGWWELLVENLGTVSWSKITIVFQPSTAIVVRPLTVSLSKLQIGTTSSARNRISIRPNQKPETKVFLLDFEVVLQAAGKYDRPSGVFEIPI